MIFNNTSLQEKYDKLLKQIPSQDKPLKKEKPHSEKYILQEDETEKTNSKTTNGYSINSMNFNINNSGESKGNSENIEEIKKLKPKVNQSNSEDDEYKKIKEDYNKLEQNYIDLCTANTELKEKYEQLKLERMESEERNKNNTQTHLNIPTDLKENIQTKDEKLTEEGLKQRQDDLVLENDKLKKEIEELKKEIENLKKNSSNPNDGGKTEGDKDLLPKDLKDQSKNPENNKIIMNFKDQGNENASLGLETLKEALSMIGDEEFYDLSYELMPGLMTSKAENMTVEEKDDEKKREKFYKLYEEMQPENINSNENADIKKTGTKKINLFLAKLSNQNPKPTLKEEKEDLLKLFRFIIRRWRNAMDQVKADEKIMASHKKQLESVINVIFTEDYQKIQNLYETEKKRLEVIYQKLLDGMQKGCKYPELIEIWKGLINIYNQTNSNTGNFTQIVMLRQSVQIINGIINKFNLKTKNDLKEIYSGLTTFRDKLIEIENLKQDLKDSTTLNKKIFDIEREKNLLQDNLKKAKIDYTKKELQNRTKYEKETQKLKECIMENMNEIYRMRKIYDLFEQAIKKHQNSISKLVTVENEKQEKTKEFEEISTELESLEKFVKDAKMENLKFRKNLKEEDEEEGTSNIEIKNTENETIFILKNNNKQEEEKEIEIDTKEEGMTIEDTITYLQRKVKERNKNDTEKENELISLRNKVRNLEEKVKTTEKAYNALRYKQN